MCNGTTCVPGRSDDIRQVWELNCLNAGRTPNISSEVGLSHSNNETCESERSEGDSGSSLS